MVDSILAYDPVAGINSLKKFDGNHEAGKKAELKAACQEFEAVLTSIILKEGMQSAKEMSKVDGGANDEDKGSQMYIDMAHEQMAYYVGKNGMLGLGDTIYNSLESRMGKEVQQQVQEEIKK
jgi:Rod binding domain-containing protein